MAQQTILIDDIDGNTGNVSTVTFSLNSDTYEIDLSEEHARHLHETLEYWITHARKVKIARKTRQCANVLSKAAQVRAWANRNGYEIAQRGKISRDIYQAYEAARQNESHTPEHPSFPQ